MSASKNLEDCYAKELAGHWSANDQMLKIIGRLADKSSDPKLTKRPKKAAKGIGKQDYAAKLDSVTAEIQRADENMIDLAERSVNLQAMG